FPDTPAAARPPRPFGWELAEFGAHCRIAAQPLAARRACVDMIGALGRHILAVTQHRNKRLSFAAIHINPPYSGDFQIRRNCSRAEKRRDFTVPSGISNMRDSSSYE